MRVKWLAQEHNTMSPARARTRTVRSVDERTNHEATAPPAIGVIYVAVNRISPSENSSQVMQLENTIERFSIECRKTKTKVITLANQSEPIKTRSNCM